MATLLRIVRWSDAPKYAGLKQTQMVVAIEEEEFPRPVLLRDGGRAVGFYEDEIADWQEYRRRKRDKAFAGSYKKWLASKQPDAAVPDVPQ